MKVSYTAPAKHGKSHIVFLYLYHKKILSLFSDGTRRWMFLGIPYDNYYAFEYQYQTPWGLRHWYYLKETVTSEDILSTDPGRYLKHMRRSCIDADTLDYKKLFDADLIIHPIKMLGYCGDIGSEEFAEKLEKLSPDFAPSEEVISHLRSRKNLIAYNSNLEQMVKRNFMFGPSSGFEFIFDYVNVVKQKLAATFRLYEVYPKVFEHYDIPYTMFDLDKCDYEGATGLYCPQFILNDIEYPRIQKIKFNTDKYVNKYLNESKIRKMV